MEFNFAKAFLHLFDKSDRTYHKIIDAGKTTAPVTGPLVQAILIKNGLPTDAQSAGAAAVSVLVSAAASKLPLPAGEADLLGEFVNQHIGLLVPPVK